MKVKCFLWSILSVLITTTAFAQDRTECERIAGIVFEAVGRQDLEPIKPHLSAKFEISGQISPVAEKVLEMLVHGLGSIKSFTLTEARVDTCLTLNYSVEYEKHGKKQASFVFDENNKIKKMNLLSIKVKTVTHDSAAIEYNPSNVIEIPFTTMEDLIVVKASIDGEERNFILDSGTGFTVINSKYIRKDTTDTSRKNQTILGSSKGIHDENLSGTDIVRTNIDFYGIRMLGQDVVTHDLSHLELDGNKIYGLIGCDLLEKYDVLFDYEKKVVILIKPDYFETYRKEKFPQNLIESVPFEMRRHIPVLPVKIEDRYYKMGLDCGANVNLLDIAFLPQMKAFMKEITTKELNGLSKSKKDVVHAVLKKFYVGTILFPDTKIIFSDISHLNKDKDVKLDGLLGYEFLSKQTTLLSYQRKELLLIRK